MKMQLLAKLEEILRKQFLFALISCLLAAFIYGTTGKLLGGYSYWGSHMNGHFYLGHQTNSSVIEVKAYQYWLSAGTMWLMNVTAIWCIVCTTVYFHRKKRHK